FAPTAERPSLPWPRSGHRSRAAEGRTAPEERGDTQVRDFGLVDYKDAWALQHRLVDERLAGDHEDVLLLIEHPHVVTLGRGARPAARLPASGLRVPVVEVERGGMATYHGPGQLVGYPIRTLRGPDRDVDKYLRSIERGLVGTLAAFGIEAHARPGTQFTGVWVGAKKIASIGVAIERREDRWVTYHGFALNVTTDLSYFSHIDPCGFDAGVMTRMADLVDVDITDVKRAIRRAV
ncbi:MAG: lipoyl(octanoyl) transferase LipB, partial [Methanobacteriota archaeon]